MKTEKQIELEHADASADRVLSIINNSSLSGKEKSTLSLHMATSVMQTKDISSAAARVLQNAQEELWHSYWDAVSKGILNPKRLGRTPKIA